MRTTHPDLIPRPDLDVYLELKARVHGDVTLSLL